ncbi:MAG: helix-turn-helix domain-containing protein [Candidatus Velthaea sp.]
MPLRTFLRNLRQRIDPQCQALGPYARLPARRGKPVTQEEVAEAIGVSRVWYSMLESSAKIRASAALLDRLSRTLMLNPEERAELFRLAIPELALGPAGAAAPAPRTKTESLLDALPPIAATASAVYLSQTESAANALARARAHYHQTGAPGDARKPRSRVYASWNRCREMHVDPERMAAPYCGDLAERRCAHERLVEAAEPVVAFLTERLAGTGYVVALTDADGVILDLSGDLDTRRELAPVEFEPGGDWSEASAGTNAIGTVLADRRPLQLWASEHYCAGATTLTCTAAPIYEPGTLDIAGVLAVTASYKRVVRPDLLGAIMQAALEIEELLASALVYR